MNKDHKTMLIIAIVSALLGVFSIRLYLHPIYVIAKAVDTLNSPTCSRDLSTYVDIQAVKYAIFERAMNEAITDPSDSSQVIGATLAKAFMDNLIDVNFICSQVRTKYTDKENSIDYESVLNYVKGSKLKYHSTSYATVEINNPVNNEELIIGLSREGLTWKIVSISTKE